MLKKNQHLGNRIAQSWKKSVIGLSKKLILLTSSLILSICCNLYFTKVAASSIFTFLFLFSCFNI